MNAELLWPWAELCQVFGAVPGPGQAPAIAGLSIDSRSTRPGDLFIALSSDPGPRFHNSSKNAPQKNTRDGHDYLAAAVNAGASAVLVHREVDCGVPALRVPDTLDGLWQLAQAARARTQGRIIAITGSSGKTTLRLWLETLLGGLFTKVHASTSSLNNHWGVPLSLGRMPADTDYGIFEIGTNHPGEIQPLSELVAPQIALVLNLLPAHIGNFPSMQTLREEKLSIAKGLSRGGTLILPREIATGAGHRVITFGTDMRADVHGVVDPDGYDALHGPGSSVTEGASLIHASVMGQTIELEIPFTGAHRLESLLATLAVLAALEVNLEAALPGFRSLALPPGRGGRMVLSEVTLIDDSYNANPVSMRLAIDALQGAAGPGRKIALLGEMLELGEAGEASHTEVGRQCAGLDLVVTFGAGFNHVAPEHSGQAHYDKLDDFDLAAFIAALRPGDQILVKGSNQVFWQNNFVARLRAGLEAQQGS